MPGPFLKEQAPPHGASSNGAVRHSHRKTSATAAAGAAAAALAGGVVSAPAPTTATSASGGPTRGSPPMLVNSGGNSSGAGTASPTGSSGTSSTGCVRWCMNVALQSFTGEPWAVTLQPAAEDDFVLNGSFHGSPAEASIVPPASVPIHPVATTTTAAANSKLQMQQQQQQLPGQQQQGGQGSANNTPSGSGSRGTSPVHSPMGTRMSPSMLRSGLQLAAIDYSDPQPQYPGGPVLDAAVFGYDPMSEDSAGLHQCVSAVNNPPVTYGVDDLLGRITNVEFIAEQGTAEETAAGVPMHYRLASSLEPMLNATLNPAITAVVDHCVSSIVLVYGATQEMKQMGLIGTPEECGLLPHGIRTLMERFLERKEHQLSKAATAKTGTGASAAGSPPSASSPGADDRSDSDRTEGVHSRSGTSQAYSFVFPSIGSRHHRFVRMEATFIAFDSTSVVDLLDLANKHVELVLKLAPPPTPSAFEEKGDDGKASSGASATTDSFVLNARAMPVENTNDALSALDVGLENLSRALELSLLQSESGSSLLFSLTAFTDTCRCATMHVLCLAEDPAAQTWLASTVQARSQAIPLGEEQSWASIQNTPMPPPLHHHAATMLVPALCFGNMFTSVLICVYNSITALSRLNRDLTFAVTGYRMRTIPRVTLASSRRGLKKLPPSWEEYFTNDGRRYFIDTATQTTTWEDPRFTQPQRSSRSGGGGSANSSPGSTSGASAGGASSRSGGAGPQHRPSRIGLGSGDRDFLANRLQQELHGGSSSSAQSLLKNSSRFLTPGSSVTGEEPLDIGIVVVDTMCRPRVLLDSRNPQFAAQCREQEDALREKQRELEAAAAELRREAEAKAQAAAAESAAAAAVAAATASAAEAPAAGSALAPAACAEVGDGAPAVVLVTAKPSEVVQTIADPTALTRPERALSTVSGFIGLDDVDDEEVSSLCRSTSANINDFTFDDDEEAGAAAVAAPTCMTDVIGADGGDTAPLEGVTAKAGRAGSAHAEARFYANALHEQAVGVAEMSASSAAASAISTPTIGGSAAPSLDERSAGEAPALGTSIAAVPPEVQDLESLVDEFTAFYRRTLGLQQRVVKLEAELKRCRSATPAARSRPASPPAPELITQMRVSVEASPSAHVRASLGPMLESFLENTDGAAASTSAAALEVFQEALRLAAHAPKL